MDVTESKTIKISNIPSEADTLGLVLHCERLFGSVAGCELTKGASVGFVTFDSPQVCPPSPSLQCQGQHVAVVVLY